MPSFFKPRNLLFRLSFLSCRAKQKVPVALFFLLLFFLQTSERVYGQSKFVQWAENPLGFYPLGLESGNGFYSRLHSGNLCIGRNVFEKRYIAKYRFSVFKEPVLHGLRQPPGHIG